MPTVASLCMVTDVDLFVSLKYAALPSVVASGTELFAWENAITRDLPAQRFRVWVLEGGSLSAMEYPSLLHATFANASSFHVDILSFLILVFVHQRLNVKNFKHPGGRIINFYLGKDATDAFREFHTRSPKAQKMVKVWKKRRPDETVRLFCFCV